MALTDPIIQFQKERASVPFQPPTLCTAETFPLLLAGVPALRKILLMIMAAMILILIALLAALRIKEKKHHK